jgi:hypothetical protein
MPRRLPSAPLPSAATSRATAANQKRPDQTTPLPRLSSENFLYWHQGAAQTQGLQRRNRIQRAAAAGPGRRRDHRLPQPHPRRAGLQPADRRDRTGSWPPVPRARSSRDRARPARSRACPASNPSAGASQNPILAALRTSSPSTMVSSAAIHTSGPMSRVQDRIVVPSWVRLSQAGWASSSHQGGGVGPMSGMSPAVMMVLPSPLEPRQLVARILRGSAFPQVRRCPRQDSNLPRCHRGRRQPLGADHLEAPAVSCNVLVGHSRRG